MPADVISCLRSLLIAATLAAPARAVDGAEQGPACDPVTDYAVAIEGWKKAHRPDAAPVPDRPWRRRAEHADPGLRGRGLP